CLRSSSSGTLSSAERLISSISRRCRRTLASSSLSLSNVFSDGCAAADGCSPISGNTVHVTPSSAVGVGSSGTGSSGAAARRTVNRPAILAPRHGELEFFHQSHGLTFDRSFCYRRVQHEFLELRRNLVGRLDLIERPATINRLANERIVIRNRAQECIAQRVREIAAPQTGIEHTLAEAIDDPPRVWSLAEPFIDCRHQLFRVTKSRHRRFADDEKLVRAEQHAV